MGPRRDTLYFYDHIKVKEDRKRESKGVKTIMSDLKIW